MNQAPNHNIAERPADRIKARLDSAEMRAQLRAVLPQHVSIERFCRVALMALSSNDMLSKCEPRSFLIACRDAAADGLLPDGREGAIVPYRDNRTGNIDAQWQPMVWGLVKMVRQSGELLDIGAEIIRDTDKFERWVDESGPHFRHTPDILVQGRPIGVYAFARTKDGGFYIEVLSWADVEKFRALSKAKTGPWQTWGDEMAKVRAIKRLCKRLPMSTDASDALARDDERDVQAMGVAEAAASDPIALMNRSIGAAQPAAALPAATYPEGAVTYAQAREAIDRAGVPDDLDDAEALIARVDDASQRAELAELLNQRADAIAEGR